MDVGVTQVCLRPPSGSKYTVRRKYNVGMAECMMKMQTAREIVESKRKHDADNRSAGSVVVQADKRSCRDRVKAESVSQLSSAVSACASASGL